MSVLVYAMLIYMEINQPKEITEGLLLQEKGQIEEGGWSIVTGMQRFTFEQFEEKWQSLLPLVYSMLDKGWQVEAFKMVAYNAFSANFDYAKNLCGTFSTQQFNDIWYASFLKAQMSREVHEDIRGLIIDEYCDEVFGIEDIHAREDVISLMLVNPEYYSTQMLAKLRASYQEYFQKYAIEPEASDSNSDKIK